MRLEIVMVKSEHWLLIAMNFHDIPPRFKATLPPLQGLAVLAATTFGQIEKENPVGPAKLLKS